MLRPGPGGVDGKPIAMTIMRCGAAKAKFCLFYGAAHTYSKWPDPTPIEAR